MPVTVKDFSEMLKKDVFTDKGTYCGKVQDVGLDMEKFRVRSIIVDAVRGSFLAEMVGDKKGVVIPFSIVESIGDIVIIKHISPTTADMDETSRESTEASSINF
ncbi:MAG: PRC-barrel domain-containing protein [Candidatus Aenigmatarchaeota archaeon]